MAHLEHPDLARRARRAYELGRARQSLYRAWPVLPMAAVSLTLCGNAMLSVSTGLTLLALVAALHWRGAPLSRAAGPGLAAGLAPLLLPLLSSSHGVVCVGGTCMPLCLLSCAAGGLIASAVLCARAARLDEGRGSFLVAAALVAALAGSLGCAIAGTVGLLGMAAGVLLGSAPILIMTPARRT